MKRLMKQMKQETIPDVQEVIIRMSDKELVIPNAEVTKVTMGQEVYQVSGAGHERPLSSGANAESEAKLKPEDIEIKDADVAVLLEKTGAKKEDAIKALQDNEGDLVRALLALRK